MPTVVLHQFPPAAGLPSFSPFCWKVQMALRARGVDHVVHNTIFAKRHNPRGKLPWLVWDGEGIEDSSAIVRAIDERAGPGTRLVPGDAKERGEAHILEDWADESLYFHAMYAKFADPDGWAHTKGPFAEMMPAAARPLGPRIGRFGALRRLRHQGLLTRDPRLVQQELERHLDALDARLEGRTHLVGNALSIADISVTPMLAQLTAGMTPRHGDLIARRPNLSRYLAATRAATGRCITDRAH